VFQLLGIAWLSIEMKRFDPSLRFSQLGLIQLLTLMHALSIMIRLGYTVFLTPRPLVQDDVFMSYTLMFQGVLMLLSAMVFNNHYLETLLYAEESQSAQIRQQEQLLQAELDRTEKLRLEQSRLLLMLEHQLRNPMSVLQLTLSDPSVALEPAKRAAQSLKDMQTLLERCVFMDKLDHQAIVLNPELCNVAALLENIVQAHAQGHRVELEASHVPLLMADMILLNIVLSNLIDNALKYSPPLTSVQVEVLHLSEPSHQLQVTVSNAVHDATVMPDADKLFSKYYRSVSSQHMDGTGLGLYLVHKMLELMQDSIRYAPVDNTVRFVLCFKL
jgi:signal transduction histidine kinase